MRGVLASAGTLIFCDLNLGVTNCCRLRGLKSSMFFNRSLGGETKEPDMDAERGVYCGACRSSMHLSMDKETADLLLHSSRHRLRGFVSQQRYRRAQVKIFMKNRSFFRRWVYARMRIAMGCFLEITRIGLTLRCKVDAALRLPGRGKRVLSTRLKIAARRHTRFRAREDRKQFFGRNADPAEGGGERAGGCGDGEGAAH